MNRPGTPVSVAFTRGGMMIVGNDGYYGKQSKRSTRQLWYYDNPLAQDDTPGSVLRLPMGTPGDLFFDEQGNLIVRDKTWSRIFKIDPERESSFWHKLYPND